MNSTRFRFGKGFRVGIGNKRAQSAEMVLAPGESEGGTENHHRGADQWLYVVSGKGVVIVDGKRSAVGPKTLVLIERGENHEIRNTGSTPLRTFNIYVPKAYTKDGATLPAGRK